MNKLSIEELKLMRDLQENVENHAMAEALDELISIRELKGDQVPVAQIVISKNWPDVGRKVIDYYLEKIQHLPAGTELFTAPQKPVVLLNKITQSDAPEVAEISAQVERLGLKGAYGAYAAGWNAAIEASGGIVKDGA
ncbi:hypothetical protein [Rahnella sp. PCH160]|uniref:hypothetical protein n=1 Tax=Rahnella sp. PCH160 TaxID=3447928 RepID=UPI0039FD0EA1